MESMWIAIGNVSALGLPLFDMEDRKVLTFTTRGAAVDYIENVLNNSADNFSFWQLKGQ